MFCILALIFDRFTGSFFQLPNQVSKKVKCDAWATACPAPVHPGDNLMKNALIVKEIYDKNRKAAEVEMKICEEPYKVALAFDTTKLNFRFGYAVRLLQFYFINEENFFFQLCYFFLDLL